MRRTNLRLRKGTVRVRQGRRMGPSTVTFCAARSFPWQPLSRDPAGWYRAAAAFAVLDGEAAPTPVCPASPAAGAPRAPPGTQDWAPPIPARVSFGWFRWGKATPEEAPEKVWASRGGTMVGGSGAARTCRAAPLPPGGRGGGTLLPATDFSPQIEGSCPLSARSRSPFSLIAF